MRDMLIECFSLYRNEDLIFHGRDEDGRIIHGYYNRGKINAKEPDLRLYYDGNNRTTGGEFLSLWMKISKTGRKYLIGNDKENGICYIGLLNLNRFDDSEPYLTIYQVLKFNR